jgi:hypothetical protein
MYKFNVSQNLKLAVRNEIVPIEHYLRQPQRLVQAITDPRRVEQRGSCEFRLSLRPLDFLMLRFQPVADLQVWADEEGTIHLRSLKCELRGVEFLQRSFFFQLVGTLSPHPAGSITHLEGKAELKVELQLPPPLQMVPTAIVEQTGTALLNGVLSTIKYRLERQLVQDYQRWAQDSTVTPLSSPGQPVNSLVSS